MIQHKISAWIATLAAVLVSIGCYLLAEELGRPLLYREVELPLLARVFYTDARWIYFFPAPFGLWASIYSLRGKVDARHGILLITTALSVSLIFLAWFLLGIVMPWIPGAPSLLSHP